MLVTANDLGLGTTRTYDNLLGAATGGIGRWMLGDQPYVVSENGTLRVVFSPTQSYWFSPNGSSFTPLYGAKESLSADTSDRLLIFKELDGTVDTFWDLSFGDAKAGELVSRNQPDGSVQAVTATDSDAGNQVSAMQWQVSASAAPYQTETLAYYDAVQDPANVGRLETITLSGYNGTALVAARSVTYAYYNGVTHAAYGGAGDLESATEYVYDSNGLNPTAVGSYYYRYFLNPDCLRLALTPQGVANAGGLTTVEAESALAPYAENAFQYDTMGRVALSTVDGLYSYAYAYWPDVGYSIAPNVWQLETTESDYGFEHPRRGTAGEHERRLHQPHRRDPPHRPFRHRQRRALGDRHPVRDKLL